MKKKPSKVTEPQAWTAFKWGSWTPKEYKRLKSAKDFEAMLQRMTFKAGWDAAIRAKRGKP